jgi:hypothetical protein
MAIQQQLSEAFVFTATTASVASIALLSRFKAAGAPLAPLWGLSRWH